MGRTRADSYPEPGMSGSFERDRTRQNRPRPSSSSSNVLRDECINTHRLGGEPLYNIVALSTGSRRLPRASPRDAVLSAFAFSRERNRHDGENITLGYSREPPVLARFGWISVITNVARGTRFAPKRLPSRRWVSIHSSASTQSRTIGLQHP